MQRGRLGQAGDAGGVPRHEGRGRLGRGVHRGRARSRPTPTSCRAVGVRSSGTTGTCATSRRCATRCTSTDRSPGSSSARRAAWRERRDARPARGRLAQVPNDVSPTGHAPGRMTKRRSGACSREHVDGASAAARGGVRPDHATTRRRGADRSYFLYPFYNRRTDEYGGSFENRIRFTREMLEDVRRRSTTARSASASRSTPSRSRSGSAIAASGRPGRARRVHRACSTTSSTTGTSTSARIELGRGCRLRHASSRPTTRPSTRASPRRSPPSRWSTSAASPIPT